MYLKSKDLEKRYSIFPISHPDLWKMYKDDLDQLWVAEEVNFEKDDFDSLKPEEKLYLKNIIAFFAISDGLVIDNLATNFLNEVEILEVQYYYGNQALIEQVHAEVYSLIIETYIKDNIEKVELFNSMETNPAVNAKAKWAENWIAHPSFAHRLVAFACVEGLAFSSVFAGVFWFRSRNLMPGLGDANELIIRDEGSHYDFAVYLYNNYLKDEYQLSKEELREIVISCYEVEKVFIENSMPDGLNGLTKQEMIQYVQFVADIILNGFGCNSEFNVSNPLDYMKRIGLQSKNNFFERRIGQYTRVDIPTDNSDIFDDEDF